MKAAKIFFDRNGLSLVEIMLAVMILGTGIAGTFMLLTASMASSRVSWDVTVATTHGEHILEHIQTLGSTSEAASVNWNKWLEQQELSLLPQELIELKIKDPAADPLEIEVLIQWLSNKRKSELSLVTRLVK